MITDKELFYPNCFLGAIFLRSHEIHDGKCGDEVESRENLLEEVECTTDHTLCAAESFVEDEC